MKKVKCIDNLGVEGLLKVGNIYSVKIDDGSQYSFDLQDNCWFNKTRFEVVKEYTATKVKCINNGGAVLSLTCNKIYDVVEENRDNYIIIDDTQCKIGWLKTRFEIINDQSPPIVNPSNQALSPDPDEDRCWDLMRPYIAPGNCKCDIPKNDCLYHKDM